MCVLFCGCMNGNMWKFVLARTIDNVCIILRLYERKWFL